MVQGDEALLESWALSLHDKSPRTVELYLREVRRFADWLDPQSLTEATKQDVQRWIGEQRKSGLKGNTIRSRFYCVRPFYGWATEEHEVPSDPTAGLAVKRPHEDAPNTLSPDELRLLFKACEGPGFRERRDLAMLRLFASAGLRCEEMITLDLGDVDLTNRIASVKGKGAKTRVARFDPTTAAALDRYKRVRARHRYAGRSRLWLGQRGPLSVEAPPQILTKRATIAGIGHVHPHQLRHTFADLFLANGGSEGDLQKLGGWESPAIMRRYGEARAVDRAIVAYDRIDPMKGL